MGLLNLFGIGAGGTGGSALDRFTTGLGSEGGLLSKFGKGQYGGQPSQGLAGLGEGGFREFLQKLMPQQDTQPQGSDPSPQPQLGAGAPRTLPTGLAGLISQYLSQMRR